MQPKIKGKKETTTKQITGKSITKKKKKLFNLNQHSDEKRWWKDRDIICLNFSRSQGNHMTHEDKKWKIYKRQK